MATPNLSQPLSACQVPVKPVADSEIPYYLESVAKSDSDYARKTAESLDVGFRELLFPSCGIWAVVGSCPNGHQYTKRLNCGREWCETCRDDSHNRRISRWYPKLQQLDSVGYMVITFPKPLRVLFRHKKALSAVGKKTTKVLKKHGFDKGLRRWHYFGDKSNDYNPHLNLLVPGRYLRGNELELLKDDLRQALISDNIANHYGRDLVINYQYHKTPARIYHKLKYVTRATFLNVDWDLPLACALYGFRNCNTWGTWSDDPKWTIESEATEFINEIQSLDKKICPCCGDVLTWVPPLPYHYIESDKNISYGGGFYRLPDNIPIDFIKLKYKPIGVNKKHVLIAAKYRNEKSAKIDLLTGEIKLYYTD